MLVQGESGFGDERGETMPRKVELHLGEDGWNEIEPYCYYGPEVNKIAFSIGIELGSNEHFAFLGRLAEIGKYFVERHGHRTERFTRAEAHAALEDIRKSQSYSYASICSLNALAESYLFFPLLEATKDLTFKSGSVWGGLMNDRIDPENIERAVDMDIQDLKSKKGANQKPEIFLAVSKLCDLYKQLTGKPVTHSNKRSDLSYIQEPQSEAGKFVSQCFQLFDNSVRATQISASLRAYVQWKKK